jgi:hypothetical protein
MWEFKAIGGGRDEVKEGLSLLSRRAMIHGSSRGDVLPGGTAG